MQFSWGLMAALPLSVAMLGCTPPPTQELALSDMVPRSDPRPLDAPLFTVYFDVGSAVLTADAAAVLDQLINDPARSGWTRITLAGHADRSGSARLNRRLSAARIAAVRQRLVEAGIPATLIATKVVGERQARPGGASEDRRVEIFVTG